MDLSVPRIRLRTALNDWSIAARDSVDALEGTFPPIGSGETSLGDLRLGKLSSRKELLSSGSQRIAGKFRAAVGSQSMETSLLGRGEKKS